MEQYLQQRAEEIKRNWRQEPFKNSDEEANWWIDRHTETTTHLIEMMREMVEKEIENQEKMEDKDKQDVVKNVHAIQSLHSVLSQLPNQKQS